MRGPISLYPPGAPLLAPSFYYFIDDPRLPTPIRNELLGITSAVSYPIPNIAPSTFVASLTSAIAMTLLAFGILGWGTLVTRVASLPILFSPPIGALIASLIVQLLGFCGMLHYAHSLLLLIVAVGGAFIPTPHKRGYAITKSNLIPLLFICSFLLITIVLTLSPSMHPDALWYHIAAPRYWFTLGTIRFDPHAVQYAQASIWDYLYIWPQILLTTADGKGLIAAHLFSQWINLFWGVFPSILILYALGKHLLEIKKGFSSLEPSSTWIVVALLGVLTCPELLYTETTPKNDWGALLFCLSGLLFTLKESPRIAALFFGTAVATKLSYLLPVVLFLLLQTHYLRKTKSSPQSTSATAFLFFMIPILSLTIRNYLWTHNPFFPSLSAFFSSPFDLSIWREGLKNYEFSFSGISLPVIWNKLGGFASLQQPTAYGIILFLFKKTRDFFHPVLTYLLASTVLSMLFFILASGPLAEARLIGISPILFSYLGIFGVLAFITSHSRDFAAPLAPGILSLALFIGGIRQIDFRWITFQNPYKTIAESQGGASLSYLSTHGASGVALLVDTAIYYYLPYGGVRVWDDASLKNLRLSGATSVDTLRGLTLAGFNYIATSRRSIDIYFDKETVSSTIQLLRKCPEASIVEGSFDRLFDLNIFFSSKCELR